MNVRRAPLAWRVALQLVPDGFRNEFGAAIEETALARAATMRTSERLAFWARELLCLGLVAVTERLAANRHGSTKPPERRRKPMLDSAREFRFAARRLVRARVFSLASVLTLALALGAVLSIWTVVRNVILDPLPFPASDRLIALEHGVPGVGADRGVGITTGLYVEYRRGVQSLEGAGIYQPRRYTMTGAGDPAVLPAIAATATLGEVLGVPPRLGRWFTDEEGTQGGPRAAVLSHALWRDRFGADAGILGQAVLLDDLPYDVVGVMGPEFRFLDQEVSIWIAMGEPVPERLGGFAYQGVGRMAAGVGIDRAKREMDAVIGRLPEIFPSDPATSIVIEEAKLTSVPRTLKDVQVGTLARTMWLLLASAGLVLLLACANVANLFLVRAEARHGELAVRRALGAGRGGVFAQYLSEAMILALVGGAIGIAVSVGAVGALRAWAPVQLPRLDEIRIDAGIVASGIALAIAIGILLGMLPLARRVQPLAAVLQDAARRTTGSTGRVRARWVLVASQVALAFVLLVSCGLMTRSFVFLSRVDPGFDADGVLSFRVNLPAARYEDHAQAVLFHEQLLERLNALPGVASAAAISCGPLEGFCFGDPLTVEGRPGEVGQASPVVAFRRVMPDYFPTMGVRLLAGRLIDADDQRAGRSVGVISKRLAELYFPDSDPIGARVAQGMIGEDWVEVIGVVENTAMMSVTEPQGGPLLYIPLRGVDGISVSRHQLGYFVRGETSPLGLVPAIRGVLRDLDADLALASVQSLEQRVAESGARITFTLVLIAIAAGAALLLGIIGIYGVISYSVARRAGEIGVRMALGAQPRDVVGMIVRQGGLAVAAGLATGVAAAIGFSRLMSAMLFGVTPGDLPTWIASIAGLACVALIASWVPARRAAAADPVSALRAE
jgi:putative ABC transport system permease protein